MRFILYYDTNLTGEGDVGWTILERCGRGVLSTYRYVATADDKWIGLDLVKLLNAGARVVK